MAVPALSRSALSLPQEEDLLPPRFTADGRPENVALEARRKLATIIDELSDEDIDAIALNAEAHRQSGQRIYLEVSYGEVAGTTDAVLQFKKSQAHITAAYTFYKDEEEGQNKRLLRELGRMEYLEKVVMRQLETTDRANSIGVVQGMLRASSAFVKGLQSVFKQVEALSKNIEAGLQNKTAMPTADQKTAAIQAIQTALAKLQPSAPNHLAIKNMVQQQVDVLLKNIAMPVAAMRADVKASATPLATVTARNAASTSAVVTPKTAAPLSVQPTIPQPAQTLVRPGAQAAQQAAVKAAIQPILRATTPITAQPRSLEAVRTAPSIPSARFSVLATPVLAERIHTQISTQPIATRVVAAAVSKPTSPTIPQSIVQQVQTRAPITIAPVINTQPALHVVAHNPQLQRTAPTARSTFTVIESKAGQQVLSTLARTVAADTSTSTPTHIAANIHVTKADAALPASVGNAAPLHATQIATPPQVTLPQTILPQASLPLAVQQTVIQPAISTPAVTTSPIAQPSTVQPIVIQPATVQPTMAQPAAIQPTAAVSVAQPATQQAQTSTAASQTQPRMNDVSSTATAPQRPIGKQETLRSDEPTKIDGIKSLLGKTEPEKDDKKSAFKANAKSACEACTTRDCANCGVKTSTLFGLKTNTIPILRHVPEAMIDKAKKMFGINAGKCAGCAGGNCASCGAARVTADTAKVSSRFANLNKTAPQPTPK